jgi:hypothetical protein
MPLTDLVTAALEKATGLTALCQGGALSVILPAPEGERALLVCTHKASEPKVTLIGSRAVGEEKPKIEAWAEVAISFRAIYEAAVALAARLEHMRNGDEEDVGSEQASV